MKEGSCNHGQEPEAYEFCHQRGYQKMKIREKLYKNIKDLNILFTTIGEFMKLYNRSEALKDLP